LLGVFALSGLLVSVGRAQPRQTISLDGVWNFATDPDNSGESDQWYRPTAKLPPMPLPGYAPAANGKIRVPGVWDNQGYGSETDKLCHSFIGKGWYKRQIEIPRNWTGRHVFLRFTGVYRYAKVWIDEEFLGEHIGYLSAFEYDVSRHAAPGQTVTITIQVDSKQRWEVDAMYGCASVADYMDVAWGGIWGHVLLEARADTWLTDLYVQPDVPHSSCELIATLNGQTQSVDHVKLDVFDTGGLRVAEAGLGPDPRLAAGQPIRLHVPMAGAKLWTPDSPTLYTARLSLLRGGQIFDTLESRFGMRQFTVDGPHLLLNGKRLVLRGYGDDHIYLEQMAMPADKQLHLKQLRTIKSYGFNHVRHHSTIMPPEYYDACDEVGMISTAEFPICYGVFLPGTGIKWKEQVPPNTDPAPARETFRREFAAVVRQYRNHPSILCWVMGNELWSIWMPRDEFRANTPLRNEFCRIARQNDPGRLFLDADGSDEKIMDPKNDRSTLDFYVVGFDHRKNPIDNPTKFQVPPDLKKPVLAHEEGNYITFSRPDLTAQFQHNVKPLWLTAGNAKLKQLGLWQEADQWAEKSERLYALCHKYNLESLRKNPLMSGYHWWLFQDYWVTSNGIVDHYFRPKSISKEEVQKINSEVVLLQNGLDKTYRGGKRLEVKLLVSNFSSKLLQGKLLWEVKAGNQSIAKRQVGLKGPRQGDVTEVGQISLDLPAASAPTKVKIVAELVADKKRHQNDWTAWLYPAVIKPGALPVPVFADEARVAMLRDWGAKPLPAEGTLSDRAVYVTSRFADPRLIDVLQRGACFIVLDSLEHALKFRTVAFGTSWWRGTGACQANYTGTLVYDHPVTRAMAPEGWCDAGWCYLLDGAKKHCLETAPCRPDVIIRGLPTMELVEDNAFLYEVGVGKGCLIVSDLNHEKAAGRPENDWLIARLLEHAAARPQPKATWPVAFLSAIANRLGGFQHVISHTKGATGVLLSYRAEKAPVFQCSQLKAGNWLTWETAPVPANLSDDQAIFAFAGGLCYSSAPPSKGFVLEINGKESLRFDVCHNDVWESTWQSADGRVELEFDSLRYTSGGDPVGVFYLKVPRDLLQLGQPCRLTVRSLGGGSGRWFGLNGYGDVK
jgi:hypothetical protein